MPERHCDARRIRRPPPPFPKPRAERGRRNPRSRAGGRGPMAAPASTQQPSGSCADRCPLHWAAAPGTSNLFQQIAFALRYVDDGAATVRAAAVAPVELEIFHRVLGKPIVFVIVRQLFARSNVTDRVDPDVLPLDDGFT